jgi:hypothetical protein
VDHDSVRCYLCDTDSPRDVAFPCVHDRRGHVYLGPDRARLNRWASAFVCAQCAAHIASAPQHDPAADAGRRVLVALYEAGWRVLP